MSDRRLHLETQAAERLREKLVAAYGEDADLIRDCIEGQTSLHEALNWAATQLLLMERQKDSFQAAKADLEERETRHSKRVADMRNAIQAAMEIGELASVKTAAATLTIKPNPPSVTITNEADIPPIFMVQPPLPPARPDKRAIAAALKEKQDVPGAALSNQPPSLQVRFK